MKISLAALFIGIGVALGWPQVANQAMGTGSLREKLDTVSRIAMNVLQSLGAMAAVLELLERSLHHSRRSRRKQRQVSSDTGDLALDISRKVLEASAEAHPDLKFASRVSEDELKARLDIYLNRLIEVGLSAELNEAEKRRELAHAKARFCQILTELSILNNDVLSQPPYTNWMARHCLPPEVNPLPVETAVLPPDPPVARSKAHPLPNSDDLLYDDSAMDFLMDDRDP